MEEVNNDDSYIYARRTCTSHARSHSIPAGQMGIIGLGYVGLPVALLFALVVCTRLVRLSSPVLLLLARAQDQTVDNARTIRAFLIVACRW